MEIKCDEYNADTKQCAGGSCEGELKTSLCCYKCAEKDKCKMMCGKLEDKQNV